MDIFNNKQEEIFKLGIDELTRSYMLETARWGKFLAILCFICLGLLILFGVLGGFALSMFDQANAFTAGFGIGMMFVYILIAAVYFYPSWTLYKFSTLNRKALNTYNQEQFNESLRYLKNTFKFMGIVAIIVLALYGIVIIFAILGAMVSGL